MACVIANTASGGCRPSGTASGAARHRAFSPAQGAQRAKLDLGVGGRRSLDKEGDVSGARRLGVFDSEHRKTQVGTSEPGSAGRRVLGVPDLVSG